MKLGACNRQACGVRGSWQQRSFACNRRPKHFPGSLSSIFRVIVAVNPLLVLSEGPILEAWASAPRPYLPQGCANSFSSWEGLVANDLCGDVSLFCLLRTCCRVPSGTELPVWPCFACEGFQACRNFSFFMALFEVRVPIPRHLSL